MTAARQQLGRVAEDLVAARLREAGWTVLARNVRVAALRGELDLIALDGPALAFVEVKARRAGSRGPVETPAAGSRTGQAREDPQPRRGLATRARPRGPPPPRPSLRRRRAVP